MNGLPASLRPALKRLARRLAAGLFLDMWPAWAAVSLMLSGIFALACRLFLPGAAPFLWWLWLVPVLTAAPVLLLSVRRAYRPAEVVAVADSLGGGSGALLALFERGDDRWAESPLIARASQFPIPRFQAWRRLALLVPAVAFLAAVLWLPQRVPGEGSTSVLADDIAADLSAALIELKEQELITPEEEQRLEEEIERIRRGAEERIDASSWEAADAVREQMAAGLAEKQQAVKWAAESLARFAAAAAEAGSGTSAGGIPTAELEKALEKLAQHGLLAGAPADLQKLLKGAAARGGAAQMTELTAALAKYLAETQARFGEVGRPGREFGRFDPAEFPLASDASVDGDGLSGRGGVNRGRADAELTWGKETLPFDRFKSQPLPPGAARSSDDWSPVVTLPGAPLESARLSARTGARHYDATAGSTAWRRSLAPRHQSAVRKYFGK
jgi:hypothetical protein